MIPAGYPELLSFMRARGLTDVEASRLDGFIDESDRRGASITPRQLAAAVLGSARYWEVTR